MLHSQFKFQNLVVPKPQAMKFKTLIYLFLLVCFVGKPKISHGQIDIFIDLLYEVNFLFGFQGEPRARDTDFTQYPYDLYDDGRYRPIGEEGRIINTKAQILLQSNERNIMGGFGQIQFSPISTVTIDVNHRQLFDGNNIRESNKIAISNFTFQYNRIRGRRFNLWWDVGATRYEEQDISDWGFSAGLGFSWFFKQPLSLHTGYRYHQFVEFGDGLSTLDLKLQLHIKRYFISVGYQNLGDRVSANTWLMGGGVYF